ncbi:hypothetical protein TNCV_2264831 [Trichonephila clavipes]|nr:hypothetical protein TNCV_2264831 [Trichonephila clavipes]
MESFGDASFPPAYLGRSSVQGLPNYLEETMFSHLVAKLEPRVLEDTWDIVKDPNPNKYSVAKERLLKIFVES